MHIRNRGTGAGILALVGGILAVIPLSLHGTSAASAQDGQSAAVQVLEPRHTTPAPSQPRVREAEDHAAVAPENQRTQDESQPRNDKQQVMGIQRGLNLQGYDAGQVDGILGPKTAGAIVAYQEDRNLSVDGKPSQELYDRLYDDATAPSHAAPTEEDRPATAAKPAGGEGDVPEAAGSKPAPGERDSVRSARYGPPETAREDTPLTRLQSSSVLERAVITVFNFMRDSSLFILDAFDEEETAPAPHPAGGTARGDTEQLADGGTDTPR